MNNFMPRKEIISYRSTLLCFFLLPVFSFFSPRSSVVIFSFLSIFSILHFFTNITTYQTLKNHIVNNKFFSFGILLFLLCLSISAIQAYPSKEPLIVFFKFSSMLILGGLFFEYIKSFHSQKRNHFLKALFSGCVIGAVLLLSDVFLDGRLSVAKHYEPARVYAKITLIISMIAPLALFYIKKPVLKILWISFFLFMFYFGFCDTATLAFITSCCLYYILKISSLKHIIYRYSGLLVFLCILILPFGLKKAFHFNDENYLQNQKIITELSYKHRLEIWKDIISAIEKKPILGSGISSSKNEEIVGANKQFIFKKDSQTIVIPYAIHHPHNYILQLWLELGFIGAFIWGILTYYLLSKLKLFSSAKPILLLFCATQIHLLFSISMWQTWWWAALYFIFPLLSVLTDE